MADSAYPRLAGTLVPVFALRHENDFGIGDTEAVRQAISFCAEQKLGLLQVLPINETGDDNSPYNAISSVALDPRLSDPHAGAGARPAAGDAGRNVSRFAPRRIAERPGAVPAGQAAQARGFVPRLRRVRGGRSRERGPTSPTNSRPSSRTTWAGCPATRFSARCSTSTATTRSGTSGLRSTRRWPRPRSGWRTARGPRGAGALPAVHRLRAVDRVAAVGRGARLGRSRTRSGWSATFRSASAATAPMSGREHELFDLTWSGGAPPEPFFHRRRISPPLGTELGHSALRLARAPRAELRLVAAAHRRDRPDFPRLPHRPCARLFPASTAFPGCRSRTTSTPISRPEEAKVKAGGREPHFIPRPDETGGGRRAELRRGRGAPAHDPGSGRPDRGGRGGSRRGAQVCAAAAGKARHSRLRHSAIHRRPETREYIPKDEMPELSIATWGTHDHAPLVDVVPGPHPALARPGRPRGVARSAAADAFPRRERERAAGLPDRETARGVHPHAARSQVVLDDLCHQRHSRRRLALQSARHRDRRQLEPAPRPPAGRLSSRTPSSAPKLRFLREEIVKTERAP